LHLNPTTQDERQPLATVASAKQNLAGRDLNWLKRSQNRTAARLFKTIKNVVTQHLITPI